MHITRRRPRRSHRSFRPAERADSDRTESSVWAAVVFGIGPLGSPTPLRCWPFQQATLRPRLSQLLGDLALTEQPFGKIYSFRQFRHFHAQLLDTFDQFDMVFSGSAAAGRAGFQAFRVGFPDGRQRDHPGENATYRDDRNEERQNVFHYPFLGIASSRSAKSIRSARSAISCLTCSSSPMISSRSSGSRPGLRCSPAMRLAMAAATGRSTVKTPPKKTTAAIASGPLTSGSSWPAAAR